MSTTDLPGSSLLAGRYRLVERLGAGGMSVVWRGFDEVLGRQVAVKVLPPSTSADPAFRRRLRAEAQAAARLSHPHITNVYDYGEATTVDGEPVPYVVMELIDGESLAAVLARVRRLPWQAAVRISAEVAAALAAAHARGIVHRDVTPANVMLTPSGAKVVDFGISALIGENDIDPDGSLLGTPAYLAPERLEGGQVSPATDVYAVGLLIYRTLIGQLPWDVGTTTALLRAHQYTEPEPLPPVEGLPPAVAALVGRCLQKRPADRPSSAELAHVLAGVSADVPSAGRGYAADWSSESGEDTTILPSQRSWTDGFGRQRAHAVAQPFSPAGRVPPPLVPPAASVPVAVASASVLTGPSGLAGVAGLAAGSSPAPASPMAAPSDFDEQTGPLAGAAARSSRFASLRGGPVLNTPPPGPALRPAFDNPPPPPGPPTSGPGLAGDDGNAKRGRYGHTHTRRVLVIAAAVLALTVVTFGWSVAAGRRTTNSANPEPSVIPVSGKCVVSYAVWTDANGKFSAQVTVANRDDTPIKNWQLWFLMPGDQVVSGKGKVQLTQDGNAVTVSSATALSPQKPLTVPISGRYLQSNSAPLAFQLNRQTCETFVSSKPGAPSSKVETLSNGKTRLVAPSKSSGITIGPGGVVTITPTTPSTSTVGTTTPTNPTTPATTPTIPPVVPTTPATTPTTPATTPATTPTTVATTTPVQTPPTGDTSTCDPAAPVC